MSNVLKLIGWSAIFVGFLGKHLGADSGDCAFVMSIGLVNLYLCERGLVKTEKG